ncbi:MAG: SDR family NAD(P)-dependent oxidoreductase [Pyrinomonadaceae bacterium]
MSFWKDKVVLLTGASSGIGEALALEMAKRGAILGLLARRESLLRALVSKCERLGTAAREFPCDITDEIAVSDAAEKLKNEFGKIDILIANAGIGGGAKHAKDLKPSDFRRVIDTNLVGAMNSVSAVLPFMLETGSGQLVAISSLAGSRGLPKSAAYCASKAGMTAYFESVRLDVKHKGVAVTIIQPGFIKTPLTSGRTNKMPFLMELQESIPYFLRAIEKRKKFAAFPWQLATIVRAGKCFPAWLYDKIASGAKYRE